MPIENPNCSRRIRVGHLLWSLQRGGAETLLVQGLSASTNPHMEYSVGYLRPDSPHLLPELNDAGIEATSFGGVGPSSLAGLGRWLRTLDLLHSHAPLPASIARLAALVIGPRMRVYTEHGQFSAYHPLTRLVHASTLRFETELIAVSDAARMKMPKRHAERASTVHHGIEADRFRVTAEARDRAREHLGIRSGVCLLTIANFKEEKDLTTLVDAATLVKTRHPDTNFLHVGGGRSEESIKEYARLRGSPVTFLGVRHDVPNLMAAADAFVLSSVSEGLPVTIMESQAAGVPYVGTSVGGIPEVVADQVNGLLVPAGDPVALAGAISSFVQSEDLRRRLRSATLESVNSFSASIAQEKMEFLYAHLRDRTD